MLWAQQVLSIQNAANPLECGFDSSRRKAELFQPLDVRELGAIVREKNNGLLEAKLPLKEPDFVDDIFSRV